MNQIEAGHNLDKLWARAYDKLNRHVMSSNEWGLANPPKAVDFDTMGQLGENLSGFFGGLADALRDFGVQVSATAFIVMPYANRALQGPRQKNGSIYYWQPADAYAKRVGGDCNSDEDALGAAFNRICELVPKPSQHTTALAYLVKPFHGAQDKSQFNVDDAVTFRQIALNNQDEAKTCMAGYPLLDYVQRFVFLFRYELLPDGDDVLCSDDNYLKHLIGGSLSAIGVASEEVDNQLMERVVLALMLPAHEIGNALHEITLSLDSLAKKLADYKDKGLQDEIAEITERSRILERRASQFKQRGSTSGDAPWTLWYPILENKIRGRSSQGTPMWNVDALLETTKTTKIRFAKEFFSKLIDNVVSNAERAYKELNAHTPLVFRVVARHENGELILQIGNSGPAIPDPIRLLLFREPVEGTGRNGHGLWMLGKAFKNAGSPLPQVTNENGFGPVFEFRFTAQKKIV